MPLAFKPVTFISKENTNVRLNVSNNNLLMKWSALLCSSWFAQENIDEVRVYSGNLTSNMYQF